MKCVNCGAEIAPNAKFCESCGSQISYEMRREQEQLNKQGCPKCGSSNIKFQRENQGELQGKAVRRIIHQTVGYCKDCGHTWYPSVENEPVKSNNTMLWVLGWIFFFPIPAMILIWRKKNTWNLKVKIAITAIFWAILIIAGIINKVNSANLSTNNEKTNIVKETILTEKNELIEKEETTKEESYDDIEKDDVIISDTNRANRVIGTEIISENETENDKSFYYDGQIIDLMNGYGTAKVGSFSLVKAKSTDCTDDGLRSWYFDFVKKHEDCNYHIIVYDDIPDKGVYSLGSGLIQKDVSLIKDDYGSYSLGDEMGATFYTVDNSGLDIFGDL